MKRRFIGCVLLAGLTISSCMPNVKRQSAFSSRFQDNQVDAVRAVSAKITAGPAGSTSLGYPVIAAIKQGGSKAIVLFNANTGAKVWEVNAAPSTAPEFAGDLVLSEEGDVVVARDLATGAVRWNVPLRDTDFLGAARVDGVVLVSSSFGLTGGSARLGRVVGVDAKNGNILWTHEATGLFGRPAAAGGLFFVPWNQQSIAVINPQDGVETARVRSTDDVIRWVQATPEGLFYGAKGLYQWTPKSASGTKLGSSYLETPLENVPGDPLLTVDGFAIRPPGRTARDKIRFAFNPQPGEGERVQVDRDTIFLAYYRFIVAIDAQRHTVRWARTTGPTEEDEARVAQSATDSAEAYRRLQASFSAFDVESLTVTDDAVVAISGDGTIRTYSPESGAQIGSANLGMPIGAITTDLRGLTVAASGSAASAKPIREQLVELIRDPDNRLVPMRSYLIKLLAAIDEPDVTRDLLDLYRQKSIPGMLRQEIATSLKERRSGANFLLDALTGEQAHFNFLENREAPPLDVIAPTLAHMGAREAVPVLMQHLLDHETPAPYLPAILHAVQELADATVLPQIKSFIDRYKRDSAFAGEQATPLQTAATVIFKLGDASSREWLTALQKDESSHGDLRAWIAHLFADEAGDTAARSAAERVAAAREALQGRLNALREAASTFPSQLSTEVFEAEWNNHLDEMRQCAADEVTRRPDMNEVRINVTVRSEPPAGLFTTSPPDVAVAPDAAPEQQLAAIDQKTEWVENQINRLSSFRSSVRQVAYSPRSTELAKCLDAVVTPMKFPGFGRTIATRTFQMRISTLRSAGSSGPPPGFGTPPGSSTLVPWFLVSSPSLDPATGQLRPSSATNNGSSSTNTPDAGVSTTATDAGSAETDAGSARPWWLEQN